MMKTRPQRTELLRAARVLSAPKCSATMCLMVLLAILTFPAKAWAQDIAKIGDTPYESLQAAFDAAEDGSTVTLLEDADLGENMIDIWTDEGERNLTFDLNGFSLTGTDEPLYVRSGVNITIKGGTIGGPDADNACQTAIRNLGGKVNIENLTISNCRTGIYNEEDWLDEETSIPGELTIGSGVNISAAESCIDNHEAKLTLTALPVLGWGEEDYGILLREGKVINFAGEGITALPEGFKPIKIGADVELPYIITNGYAAHVKSGSEVIDPAKVFVGEDDGISMVLYEGEALMTNGSSISIQNVSVTKGDEVKQYSSLQAAFDEAEDGSTVTLLEDADLGENMIDIWTDEGERKLTFDLSGFSLTGTDEPLYVRSGVNITIKGGTIGGPDADNACQTAIRNLGGKVNIENLTISNCRTGIYNEADWPDEETSIPGELTIGSGVNISATESCIENYEAKLTLTALPMLSWGEEGDGILLREGKVINFVGEGITALPEDFKPIKIGADGELPCIITNGYAAHVKSGSEVIDPAKVFVGEDDDISMVLYEGEAMMTDGEPNNNSDLNGDGKIDIADVVVLTNAIIAGTTDLKYDINGDDEITAADILTLVDMIMSGAEVPDMAP